MSFLSNLFNPPQVQAPQVNFTPPSFSGGGLNATFGSNGYSVTPSADRNAAVSGVSQTFANQASDIAGLRSQWTPGASALRNSLMTALQNNRAQGIGNLRDNLAQRRILGSSFAQNSLASADQEYQQQIQQIQAQTFLQELGAQQQLQQQQYTAARGQFQTGLDEMNLEAGVAADLTGRATSALSSAATTQAQLDMQANTFNAQQKANYASGFGSFLGTIGGAALAPFTGGLSLGLSGLAGGLSGLMSGQGLSGAAYGGGNFMTDAYGGSASNPLPGLTAADYG